MSGRGLNRIVAGTALALVLASAYGAAAAPLDDAKAIEALIPMPDMFDVAPPTAADVGGPTTGTATATTPADPDNGSARSASPDRSLSQPSAREQAQPAAAAKTPPSVDAAIPVPEVADVPPPGVKDLDTAKSAPPPSADTALADKLRELVTSKLDRYMDRKHRSAIEAFYAARNFAPLWVDNGAVSERGKAVIARLRQADQDGLDPADYRTPEIAATAATDALADAELKLTATVLTYARHAQIGRVHFSRVSADIVYNQVPPEPADVLTNLAEAKNAGEALGSYNPPHEASRR